MTETQPLLSAIQRMAQDEAERMEKEAAQAAEALLQRAKENAQKSARKARGEAELRCAGILQSAQKKARQAQALSLLSAKHEGIERVFEKALSRAVQHPGYAAALERGILAAAQPGQTGELVLAEADKAQLPEGFFRRVGEAMEEKGASIALAEETLASGGGFVLVYDAEEQNCTLPALLETLRETLTQQVAKVLYGEEEA